MLPMQACEFCGVPDSNTYTRTMLRAHILPCASCCAVCDVLAITSSVRCPHGHSIVLSPQHKSSCCTLKCNVICLSTSKQCLEQKQDGHKQHMLLNVHVDPELTGWSSVTPRSPYSWYACSTPSRRVFSCQAICEIANEMS